jgi:hypothetical protein
MPNLTQKPSNRHWSVGAPPMPAAKRAPVRSSWLIALRCRLRRNAIDRELAAGADPGSNECRHLRASQLTAASNREALAAAYERLLGAAARFDPLDDVVSVNWRGVGAARLRLDRLVHRLREDPDVRPHGVARARVLLTDRKGALGDRTDDGRLSDEVRSTLAAL